ncbi:tetratricopeptide repeat protein [Oscillatoria sp. CS-180]|uniref:tetratricopeptide repeat protein n=1 Tax=Oscillatoria sp. CS-180 TaxID=3021720 RepID=UPI002330AEF3|nr:tetratricopeptide repeat protein [Oscillatoria sp. CS-180]MDB9529471.1 tetratricopeptide repeat protein [Oscillatoria sp. CS-180]
MRRSTPNTGFATGLKTSTYAYRFLELNGYPAIAVSRLRKTGMERCKDLYLKAWRHRESGQLRTALNIFQEGLALSRHLGHKGWISTLEKAIQLIVAELAVEEAIAPLAPEMRSKESMATRLLAQAQSRHAQGDHYGAMATYQEALQGAVQEEDTYSVAQCLNGMGLICLDWQQCSQAETYFCAASEALAELNAPMESAIAFHNWGLAHYQQAEFTGALRCFQQALDCWQAVEDTVGVAVTLDYLGRVYAQNHDYWLALGSFEAAIDVLNEMGIEQDVSDEAIALMGQIALLCEQTRHFDLALAYKADVLAAHQRAGHTSQLAAVWCHLGRLCQQLDYDVFAGHCYRQAGLV